MEDRTKYIKKQNIFQKIYARESPMEEKIIKFEWTALTVFQESSRSWAEITPSAKNRSGWEDTVKIRINSNNSFLKFNDVDLYTTVLK